MRRIARFSLSLFSLPFPHFLPCFLFFACAVQCRAHGIVCIRDSISLNICEHTYFFIPVLHFDVKGCNRWSMGRIDSAARAIRSAFFFFSLLSSLLTFTPFFQKNIYQELCTCRVNTYSHGNKIYPNESGRGR